MTGTVRFAARRLVVATALVAGLTAVACTSDQERARDHLEQAAEMLADGRRAEATLEYRSALLFDPKSVEAHAGLARVQLRNGNVVAALLYLKEANRLDPTNTEVALNLASLLRGDRPQRAEELVEEVIEREPKNPAGYIGRSSIALERGQIRAATRDARKALQLGPDDPAAEWQYGRVLQGLIRSGQITGEPADDKVFKEAVNAYERYIAKGGEAPWTAQIQQARILAAWPSRGREAAAMFRIAVETALEQGSRDDKLVAASQAAG